MFHDSGFGKEYGIMAWRTRTEELVGRGGGGGRGFLAFGGGGGCHDGLTIWIQCSWGMVIANGTFGDRVDAKEGPCCS